MNAVAEDKKVENLETELTSSLKKELKEDKKKEKKADKASKALKDKKEKNLEPGVIILKNPSKTLKGKIIIWVILGAMALSFVAALISIILKANGVI